MDPSLEAELYRQLGMRIIDGKDSKSTTFTTSVTPVNTQPARPLGRASRFLQPATIFIPDDPNLSPDQHFPLQSVSNRCDYPRFVNRFNSREILIAVDGCCLDNGSKTITPRGGCSFVFKNDGPRAPVDILLGRAPLHPAEAPASGLTVGSGPGTVSFPLEERGPSGDLRGHTSNRAKLRAVIAALQFRNWAAESWNRVVVLTDLEYVVLGATKWLPMWVKRRWRLVGRGGCGRKGSGPRGKRGPGDDKRVENRDLWEELQKCVEELREQRVEVSFWLVPPGQASMGTRLVGDAKDAARKAARGEVPDQRFVRRIGVRT